MLDIKTIRGLAGEYGFREVYLNKRSNTVGFYNKEIKCRVNITYNIHLVATCLDHPTKGKIQLYRRGVTIDTLEQIFANARAHTGTGYHTKGKGKVFIKYSSTREEWCEYLDGLTPNITSFALGNKSFACTYHDDTSDNSKVLFSKGIPKGLEDKLKGQQNQQPHPICIEIGWNDNYFVQYANGNQFYEGTEQLFLAIHQKKIDENVNVNRLALGPNGSYWILFKDGTQKWHNVPEKLEEILELRIRKNKEKNKIVAKVADVSLGDDGQFFVKFDAGAHFVKSNDRLTESLVSLKFRTILNIAFGPITADGEENFIVEYG